MYVRVQEKSCLIGAQSRKPLFGGRGVEDPNWQGVLLQEMMERTGLTVVSLGPAHTAVVRCVQQWTTVKPLNRGRFGDGPFVPCREVVLFSKVLF